MRKSRLQICLLEDRLAPAAGMLDPTFGVGGKATLAFPAPSEDLVTASAIDALGRIVVVGGNTAFSAIEVARFSPDGTLDASFGDYGKRVLINEASQTPHVAIDSMNRIVICGGRGAYNNFGVIRLTPSGDLDLGFDGDGRAVVDFGGVATLSSVAVDSMDRVVLAGTLNGNAAFAVARLTSAGTLDSTFDGDGKITFDFGTGSSPAANSVAVDSLDRVIVAGIAYINSKYGFAVARLNSSGALDPSFDGDGEIHIPMGPNGGTASAVAIDSMDRVVVAGQAYENNGDQNWAVARLTVSGVLDPTFDMDGKVIIDLGSIDGVDNLAIDSLDRPVIVGYSDVAAPDDLVVARLTVSGAFDTTFDIDGKVQLGNLFYDPTNIVVKVDSANRVQAIGTSTSFDFDVVRMTTNGTIESSFGASGEATIDFNIGMAEAHGAAVDSQGRIIVAGYANNHPVVLRYLPDGQLDSTFGTGGKLTPNFGSQYDYVTSVAVDMTDRIILGGYLGDGFHFSCVVARLTLAGNLDTTFDSDGLKVFNIGLVNEAVDAITIDQMDRIVVAGVTVTNPSAAEQDVFVARLTPAGELDSTFDTDGTQTIHLGPFNVTFCVEVDSLGRVIVGTTGTDGSSNFLAAIRFTSTGAFDMSFDGDGIATIDLSPIAEWISGIAVDSQDRVIISGASYKTYYSTDCALVRLTNNGTLDTTFNGNGKVIFDYGAVYDHSDTTVDVAVDNAGRILVGGVASTNNRNDYAVARLTDTGGLDPSFGGGGITTFHFGSGGYDFELAYAMTLDHAGRPIIAGQSLGNGAELSVARLTGDLATASVQVNDGAPQRSMVTSLKVTFSEPVTFPYGISDAFRLQHSDAGGPAGFVVLNLVQSGNTVTITFNDLYYAPGSAKSLIDGHYTLELVSSNIQSANGFFDGNADGFPGGNLLYDTFRLFGDGNGDGTVNSIDFALFRKCFGTSLNLTFDADGDGTVNASDFAEFRKRFGISLVP